MTQHIAEKINPIDKEWLEVLGGSLVSATKVSELAGAIDWLPPDNLIVSLRPNQEHSRKNRFSFRFLVRRKPIQLKTFQMQLEPQAIRLTEDDLA